MKETGATSSTQVPQRYKLYTDSEGSFRSYEGDDDDDAVRKWMVVSQSAENPEVGHTTRRIRLKDSSFSSYPVRDELILKPKRSESFGSSAIAGVQTESSNSVAGEVTDDSTSDDSIALFNSVLNDLQCYTVVRDVKGRVQSSSENNNDRESAAALSPAEEALISIAICDENAASLHGMGIYYPDSSDGLAEVSASSFDESSFWSTVSGVLQAIVKPTKETLVSMKKYCDALWKDLKPVLNSPQFQAAVVVAIVAVVTAAKMMDKKRMRNPIQLTKEFTRKGVSDDTLEKVFSAVAAKTSSPFL
eukprot:gene306-1116_t